MVIEIWAPKSGETITDRGIGFLLEQEGILDTRTVAVPLGDLRDCNVDSVVCLHSRRKRRIVQAFIDVAAALSRKGAFKAR